MSRCNDYPTALDFPARTLRLKDSASPASSDATIGAK